MSCGCNSSSPNPYYGVCREDTPYPSVSHESVPSLLDNLVTALYGAFYNPQTQTGYITKSVVNGRVVWNIACDPNNSAEVTGFPRYPGEGLLCYILRNFNHFVSLENQMVLLDATQTLTNKTLTSPHITHPTGITYEDVNADEAGSAATAQANAESYADGAANTALDSAKSYADGLAGNYDPAGAASTAESNAKSYADGLAGNYDPAGAAATAESNAKSYADGLAGNYDPAGAAASAAAAATGFTTTAPGSPTPGQIYFDTGSNHFYGWNGTTWAQLDN